MILEIIADFLPFTGLLSWALIKVHTFKMLRGSREFWRRFSATRQPFSTKTSLPVCLAHRRLRMIKTEQWLRGLAIQEV